MVVPEMFDPVQSVPVRPMTLNAPDESLVTITDIAPEFIGVQVTVVEPGTEHCALQIEFSLLESTTSTEVTGDVAPLGAVAVPVFAPFNCTVTVAGRGPKFTNSTPPTNWPACFGS